MCKMMEDMRNEAAHEAAHDKVKEKAILMLKNGKISFDEISVFFSELSDEEIEEIKSKIMQLALLVKQINRKDAWNSKM